MISHHHQRLINILKIIFIAFIVLGKCKIHLLFDADIVHHQALVLALIFAVNPRNGLNQIVLLNGFVDINTIQKRHIKPRQPHINHDSNFEIRL